MTAALDDVRPDPPGHTGGVACVPTPGGGRAEPYLAPCRRPLPGRRARTPAAARVVRPHLRAGLPDRPGPRRGHGHRGRRRPPLPRLPLRRGHARARPQPPGRRSRRSSEVLRLRRAAARRSTSPPRRRTTSPPRCSRPCRRALADRARVHFCGPAGTDAVEAALKLTRTATGAPAGARLHRRLPRHDRRGARRHRGRRAARPRRRPGRYRLPFPYAYRCPFGIGGERGAELAAALRRGLLDDPHSGVVRARRDDPRARAGRGRRHPRAGRRGCARCAAITAERGDPARSSTRCRPGVGRTGTFWGVERSGVVPDVMVLSKAIGGTLPLAVIVYRERPRRLAARRAHRHLPRQPARDGGRRRHAAPSSASRPGRAAPARLGAPDARAACASCRRGTRAFGDVRGRGLMIGVEIVDAGRRARRPRRPAARPGRWPGRSARSASSAG